MNYISITCSNNNYFVNFSALTKTGLFENAKNITENAQKDENSILADYDRTINEIIGSSTRENNNQQPNEEKTISFEEHFIGEYYFNGKTIMKTTIYISSLSSNSLVNDYKHEINNADELWFNSSKSYFKWKNLEVNHVSPIPYTRLSSDNTAKIFYLI